MNQQHVARQEKIHADHPFLNINTNLRRLENHWEGNILQCESGSQSVRFSAGLWSCQGHNLFKTKAALWSKTELMNVK